jgi:DNA-binding transcriptional ArsR family regulator
VSPASPRHTELHLGPLGEVRVSIASAPLVTVVSLVADALGGPSQGVTPEWSQLIRKTLPSEAVQAVRPVFDRSAAVLPDCLTPVGLDGLPIREQLDRIADTPPETLWQEVSELFDGDTPPLQWQRVLRRPRQWVSRYVAVLASAWRAYAPLWQQSTGLRARETERVGAAVVSGALDVLLSGINPRARFAGQTLYLPDRSPYRTALDRRPLVMLPLLSGSDASVFNLDDPELVWIGYPIPGLDSLSATQGKISQDALVLLVGPIRAAILRALSRPTTMGALAEHLDAGPSTATYHCIQLASAGLVIRQRAGREVRIQRTLRGDALVDLLS